MGTGATPPKAVGSPDLQGTDWSKENILDRIQVLIYPPQITATGMATRGAGAPVGGEVASSGRTSIFCADALDEWVFPVPGPLGADPNGNILVRAMVSQSQAAGTGSYLLTGTYLPSITGTTTQADPATALSVPFVTTVDLGADIPQNTAWAEIAANVSGVTDGTLTPGDDEILFKLETTTHTTITDLDILRVEFRFLNKYANPSC